MADDIKFIGGKLNAVKDTKKGVPLHVNNDTKPFAPLCKTRMPIYGSDAAHIFHRASNSPEDRYKLCEKLAIKDSVKVASIYPNIQAALGTIGEALTDNPGSIPEDFVVLYV